ncbi:hypothetical protein HDU97_005686 [Phlyctochytrium planicorne]|nr:hypothetical protein HDU97_005686 [Phlyctochytrium planicorne]
MPNSYMLSNPKRDTSLTDSALVLEFKGPNPNKTSCDFCRQRKRKCNGTAKECGKYGKLPPPVSTSTIVNESEESLPSSEQTQSSGRKLSKAASTSALASIHRRSRKPSVKQPRKKSTSTQSSTSALTSAVDALSPFGDELSPVRDSYPQTILWPGTATPAAPSLVHRSLDPLILFMGNIGYYDYVYQDPSQQTIYDPLDMDEEHLIVDRFCNTAVSYPFEVFEKATLISRIETIPHLLRYAFFTYCSIFSIPSAPEPITRKFYSYAKRVANWCLDNPSLAALQALLMLNISAAITIPLQTSYPGCGTTAVATIGHEPRFFQSLYTSVVNAGYFTYISPNQLTQDALMYYLSTLSEAMYHIKEAVDVKFDTIEDLRIFQSRSREAEGRLLEWRSTLPASLEMESAEAWLTSNDNHSMSQLEMDRMTLFLGYHACICLLYRSRSLVMDAFEEASLPIHDPETPLSPFPHLPFPTTKQAQRSIEIAYRSAKCIARSAVKIIGFNLYHRNVYPLPGYCMLISGLVLCGLCGKTQDDGFRKEVLGWIEAEVKFLEGVVEMWKMASSWLMTLKEELEKLRDEG